ncbi:phage minor head protein [Tardiphaga sp.]|uniref:phage minor head protein n=1 Tax=Tardiphaga sp. TaxID=1926292 RepID=UPI00262A127A|nr:phage minor head protein [Tardiphaga sp.]MDB5620516.1 putative head morphosis protein [Tardiphaga sp.]
MAVSRAYIEALIAKLEPLLRKAFDDAVNDWRNNVDLDGLARALERGDLESAVRAANIQPAALNGVTRSIETAFEQTGSAEMTGLRIQVIFNARDLRAEDQLRRAAATLVQGITDDTRAMLRTVLIDSLAKGQGGRAAGLDIAGRNVNGVRQGGYIGLTDGHAKAALNFEATLSDPAKLKSAFSNADREKWPFALRDGRLDGQIAKAIKEGRALTSDQIKTAVTTYKNRALRWRGENIARTETLRAVNSGRHEAYQQAVASGKVAEQNIRRVWNSAHDKRVRDTHRAMDKQSVGLNELFVSPSGARLRYPCDAMAPLSETAQCRCNVTIRIDHLANLR